MRLRLLSVSFDRVEFHATLDDGYERLVSVDVLSGRREWLSAVLFPGYRDDTTTSLGDDALDREVRERAAEELVRLSAATQVASGRWAA